MAQIKYHRAYIDDTDDIISIDDKRLIENPKQFKYRCIGCGHELLPRALNSKKTRPHFYHYPKDEVKCSGETYRHKLTKRILKDKFYKDPTFFIEYYVDRVCNNDGCKYRSVRCSISYSPYRVDLKKLYDTCTEETAIGDYVADLLLTNSKDPSIEPILIEVCVTNPCPPEKRESGLKIIEIKIKKEQDALDLEKRDVLSEDMDSPHIEFISFEKTIREPRTTKLPRYIYDPNHEYKNWGVLTSVDCDKAQYKVRVSNSIIEFNVVNIKDYGSLHYAEICFIVSQKKSIYRCHLCKFYYRTPYERNPICRLSKKYGKPEHPSMNEAEKCRSYIQRDTPSWHLEDYIIEEVTLPPSPMKPEYKVILATSRNFTDYNLLKEKYLYYLSEKKKTHSIIVIRGGSWWTDYLTDTLSQDLNFITEPYEADWGKYGQETIHIFNDEITSVADALIAFWDGKSTGVKDMIEQAKQKGKKVAVVNINHSQ